MSSSLIMYFIKVGHGICDLGITAISYNYARHSFIEFTHPVGLDGTVWASKPPKDLPPINNITLIFDPMSWILVLISIILVTCSLAVILIVTLRDIESSVRMADVFFIYKQLVVYSSALTSASSSCPVYFFQ